MFRSEQAPHRKKKVKVKVSRRERFHNMRSTTLQKREKETHGTVYVDRSWFHFGHTLACTTEGQRGGGGMQGEACVGSARRKRRDMSVSQEPDSCGLKPIENVS